jgi:hypothetical protein
VELKPGSRWKSAVSEVEVVVVKPPGSPVTLECGGQPMIAIDAERPAGAELDPAKAEPTLIGKRFADPESGLELLATKGGAGTLAADGTALPLKDAKPLPASD